MDNAFGMRCIQRVGNLNPKIQHLAGAQGLAFYQFLQRLPFEQLHGNEVAPRILAHVIDSADIRMVQCRSRARFALQAFGGQMIESQLGGEKFQRYTASQARVLGLVDDSHAAVAELVQYLVVRNCLASH